MDAVTASINELRQSHQNLAKIADHCRQINQSQGNKQQALHETKQFALQALSSVAYQVNISARAIQDFLKDQQGELDFQTGELNAIAQTISVTQEVVARSKVNDLSLNQPRVEGAKVVKLPEPQFSVPDRSSLKIDYRALDHVGIGQKEFSSAPFSPSPLALSAAAASAPSQPAADETRKSRVAASNEVLSFKAKSNPPPPRPPTVPTVPTAPKTPSVPTIPTVPTIDFPPPPPPEVEGELPPPPPEPVSAPSQKSGGYVKALYDYNAESPEELSIVTGELLVILVRDAGAGWMEGKNTAGKVGLFPAGYVEDV